MHHGHGYGHTGTGHQQQCGSSAGATSTRTKSRQGDCKSSKGRGAGSGGGIQVGEHMGFLRMQELPFTLSKKEIFDFFADYNPLEESICLTHRSDGRATGEEGYIAFFCSPDDAKEAMALHRNTMGQRYIELFISNKDEHGRVQAQEPPLEE